jgi:hypothetical protein
MAAYIICSYDIADTKGYERYVPGLYQFVRLVLTPQQPRTQAGDAPSFSPDRRHTLLYEIT